MFNRRPTSDAPDSSGRRAAPSEVVGPSDDSVITPSQSGIVTPTSTSAQPTDSAAVSPVEPDHAVRPGQSADSPADRPHKGLTDSGKVRRTRVSALWIGLVTAAVLAIFLLIFIAQNSAKVTIEFLGFEGQLSLAVALLLSAIIGILVVAVPGTLRIGQLRRALRKNAKG